LHRIGSRYVNVCWIFFVKIKGRIAKQLLRYYSLFKAGQIMLKHCYAKDIKAFSKWICDDW
jgi:hypothetical protein